MNYGYAAGKHHDPTDGPFIHHWRILHGWHILPLVSRMWNMRN